MCIYYKYIFFILSVPLVIFFPSTPLYQIATCTQTCLSIPFVQENDCVNITLKKLNSVSNAYHENKIYNLL